ncbi:hypothetical protein PtB15_18B421 [Puccinia triticina]|nr:hypothetical protein PtB15_18B421 [Puccinia triticina]
MTPATPNSAPPSPEPAHSTTRPKPLTVPNPADRRAVSAPFAADPAARLHSITEHSSSSPTASRTSASSQSDPPSPRKWAGTFYLWLYHTAQTQDHPTPSTPVPPSTRIAGLSKHFFAPHPRNPAPEPKPAKLSLGKKERRKLGLISGLTKQREPPGGAPSQLESPAAASASSILTTRRPNLDPHSLAEHLDALAADRSAIDSAKISALNQARFAPPPDPTSKPPKKLPFAAEAAKLTRKKTAAPERKPRDPSPSSAGPVSGQLALGPGPAMNSAGIGSGEWKLVQGVITEDGHFTLYTDTDVVVSRIYLPSYRRTDVRIVHQSIFGRPHCGVIAGRRASVANSTHGPGATCPSSTSLPATASLFRPSTNGSLASLAPSSACSTAPHASASLAGASTTETATTAPETSIYICMPSSIMLEAWLVICKCFCRPADFRHLYPRAPKSKGRVPSGPGSPSTPGTKRGSVGSARSTGAPERVRIWRAVDVLLLEGRKLGEPRLVSSVTSETASAAGRPTKDERRNSTGAFLRAQTLRNPPKPVDQPPTSGPGLNRQSLQAPPSMSSLDDKSPASSAPAAAAPHLEPAKSAPPAGSQPAADCFFFVELQWDGDVFGRSTVKRTPSPFWSEPFRFAEIGSFKTPLVLNVYQISRAPGLAAQISLVGRRALDCRALAKNAPLQLWLPIYADDTLAEPPPANLTQIVGELNLSITVIEQVVLAEAEYAKMMNFLNNDNDIELVLNLAHMAVGELDRLSELLIRIYEANERLVERISQLAALEINGDQSTASILFRANTLLTKMLEAYMRLVGRTFLEASLGAVIRRICGAKVELEIDPAKLKGSLSAHQKEKMVGENARELTKIANEIWQSMYINRSKCPGRLRKIFVKIQELVGNAYADQDMRLTSISAFVFLRFFVPAILNPRLFNLIQFQPDSKSQRTLTLVAKTLQGLGNLTLFGVKEPWMSAMNEFISTQLDSFRDYISFIASDSDGSAKPEWTSNQFEAYGLPYALRASLPPASRDGIPTLPHLLDPVRDCALLASLSSTTDQFLKLCAELYCKAERRALKILASVEGLPTPIPAELANKPPTRWKRSHTVTAEAPASTPGRLPGPSDAPALPALPPPSVRLNQADAGRLLARSHASGSLVVAGRSGRSLARPPMRRRAGAARSDSSVSLSSRGSSAFEASPGPGRVHAPRFPARFQGAGFAGEEGEEGEEGEDRATPTSRYPASALSRSSANSGASGPASSATWSTRINKIIRKNSAARS